jgi:hypothetical protein
MIFASQIQSMHSADQHLQMCGPYLKIDHNCDVLPIEYDLLIVMFVNINITITINFFFNQ